MNEKQYRKRLETQVASRARALKRKSVRSGRSAKSGRARVAEIDDMQFDLKDGKSIRRMIAVLGNSDERKDLRMAAFRALKTASFLGPAFSPYRADYLKCLRAIATDPEPEIRVEALETLAMEKVDYARRLLSEGLKNSEKALVPPAKAIQILSFDGHAEVAPLVREIFAKTTDRAAKEAALRFLSADPGSSSLLSKVLKDRSQPARIRSLSATGLRLANPKTFERVARSIVEDRSEHDDVRATCLGALTLIKDFQRTRDDPSFSKAVAALKGRKHSRALRESAKRFMSRPGK
jgi:HEAT repeat protein